MYALQTSSTNLCEKNAKVATISELCCYKNEAWIKNVTDGTKLSPCNNQVIQ